MLLPIFSLTYLESAGEFRRVQWSLPPQQVPVPLLASPEEARRGPGPLVREASGVHARPLDPLPAPSGVIMVPPEMRSSESSEHEVQPSAIRRAAPPAGAPAPFSPAGSTPRAKGSAATRMSATIGATVVVALTTAGVVLYYVTEPFK